MRGAHHAALTLTTTLLVLLIARTGGAQLAAWNSYGYINVSGMLEPVSTETFTTGRNFRIFGETGFWDIDQTVKRGGWLMDVSGGVGVWRNLAVGVGFSQAHTTNGEALVTAEVPNPIFFDRPRFASASFPLERREQAIHLQVALMVPLHDRLELSIYGGPSRFSLRQNFVLDSIRLGPETAAPLFNEVEISGLDVGEFDDSGMGVNVGADLSYMLTRWLGGGVFLRYAGASLDVPSELPVSGDVGGFQVGFGLRTRFPRRPGRRLGRQPVEPEDVTARPFSSTQSEQTLRVLRTAVVVAEPSGDADVVGTVAPGEILELLDERGSWYLVRPPDDGTPSDWRTGWINVAMVEPLRGSVSQPRGVPTAPSQAQTRSAQRRRGLYPGTETTVAWAHLRDSSLSDLSNVLVAFGGPSINDTSALGFSVATTTNFNPWFGVTTEGGGNFFSQDVGSVELFDIQIWTILAGPKFTLRLADRVAPYGRVLLGPAYVSASIPLEGVSEGFWDFALQPGGGVDIVLSDRVALRVGVDARIMSDKPFSDHTTNQFRFTTGVTFRSNFK